MQDDPFSDFLNLISARSVLSGGLVAGGPWAIAIPPPDKIKFWGVVRGNCWLLIEGEAAPIHLEEGDVFLLSAPRAVVMASDLAAPLVDLDDVLKYRVGAVAHHGTGDDCFVIGGNVELNAEYGQLLTGALPPFIHVHAGSRRAQTLCWLMDQLIQEREDDPPGAYVASTQLAHLMFIQILRAHFETTKPLTAGWLRAVTDRRLSPALRLMHNDPGRSWRLEELARAAAMSRATFALYFKTVAGIAPMSYLTEWRMRLAEQAIRENSVHIGDIGRSLGYTSESAFSNAFKRVTGRPPMRFKNAAG
ncbi:AraC family transcriptional regulator [Rhizobium sp. AC27/96]|uniref:AraC family transcriptional regulator n=1 Tax=Rhizobium sp. AC27/96 TaxID=1841653 RepID=UPI000828A806|nr:AraC family transcriptional regulator [Rhizobium sp. AC27/96]OCJ07745.1 AraC family transcriptional regulator [Rhizobium sp. AC27/96]